MILTVPFARARIGLFTDDNVGVVTLANPSNGATLALPPQRLSWRTAQPPVRSVLEIRDLESGELVEPPNRPRAGDLRRHGKQP